VTGETEREPSGWTVDTLKAFEDEKIAALERHIEGRFDAIQRELSKAIETAATAVNKAEVATERRFEGVNEFRAQLSDQAGRFVTREELHAVEEKLGAASDRNRADIDALGKRMA
jgi:hypothetical protein